jgi:hypothetical protein
MVTLESAGDAGGAEAEAAKAAKAGAARRPGSNPAWGIQRPRFCSLLFTWWKGLC